MPFPERLLGDAEEVVFDLRPHAWTLVLPTLVGLVTLAAAAAMVVVLPSGRWQVPLRGVVGLLALAVLVGWVARRYVRRASTHLVLTTDRLIYRSGVLARTARDIPLERINDISYRQALWERLLGTGDLVIESAGEQGQTWFPAVRDPEGVQRDIYALVQENRDRALAPRAPSVLDDLERLAALRERGFVTHEEYERKKRELLDRL